MKLSRTAGRPRRQLLGRIGRRTMAALAASFLLLAVSSGPAQASLWSDLEDFEGSPATTWILEHSGTGDGGFDINIGTARSPQNDAWLTSQTGFSSVGMRIHLTPAQFHNAQCAARIYVQALGTAKVNFEIINPSNWNYIALNTVTLSGGGYTAVDVGPWTPGPIDVHVRLSLLGNGGFSAVRVDDLQVSCSY